MTQITIRLPKLHPAQAQIRDSKARFKVVNAGRRAGKTQLCVALCLDCALHSGRAWWVVPSYAVGTPAFRLLTNMASQIPGATINRSDRLVTLPNGGTAQIRTADQPELLRGDSLDLLVVDEAAFCAQLETLWLDVLRPALADRQGRALFISTPNGRNFFWQLYQQGQDPARPEWESWTFPTSANPHIPAEEIAAARRDMPEARFRAEFLAEFVEGGSVFRNVRELATFKAQAGPVGGHTYYAGIDWGRSGDYTVLAIFDATDKKFVHLIRFTALEFSIQLGRVETAIHHWRPKRTIAERNSFGQAMFESLTKLQLPTQITGFTMTNESKSQLVDSFALALERKEITLLDHPVLIAELQAYQAETLPSGLTRYSAPSGGHDDCAVAALLAYGPASDTGPRELRQTWWVRS